MRLHVKCLTVHICALLFVVSTVFAQTLEYCETKGKKTTKFTWNITSKKDQTLLIASFEHQKYTTITDSYLNATRWDFADDRTKTRFTAYREKNIIRIEGALNGKQVSKIIHIDNAPWFQPLSYSLKNFILSNAKQVVFWTLNPDTLAAYKMKAQKMIVEPATRADKPVRAQKVKVSLTGPKSIFWHAFYWFDTTDGSFIQYRGVDDAPGTPETVIILTAYIP